MVALPELVPSNFTTCVLWGLWTFRNEPDACLIDWHFGVRSSLFNTGCRQSNVRASMQAFTAHPSHDGIKAMPLSVILIE